LFFLGATGNQAFKLVMNSVSAVYLPRADSFVHAFDDVAAVLRGMRAIVDAIADEDAAAAQAAAQSHLQTNSDAMIRGLKTGGGR
jgi:DNA-binding FadR family transcriptional regulator